jgi:hypothetical protein
MLDKCFDCDSTNDIHHHHVVPVSLGGTKTVPLCSSCHGKVHGEHLLKVSLMTKISLEKKKEKGERTGNIPYGCDVTKDGMLIPNREELELIQRIVDLRKDGLKLREIAIQLNENGINLRGKHFYEEKIYQILKKADEILNKKFILGNNNGYSD